MKEVFDLSVSHNFQPYGFCSSSSNYFLNDMVNLNKPGVYAFTNLSNDNVIYRVRYIGISASSIYSRLINHLKNYYGGAYTLYSTINDEMPLYSMNGKILNEDFRSEIYIGGNYETFFKDHDKYLKWIHNLIKNTNVFVWPLKNLSDPKTNKQFLEIIESNIITFYKGVDLENNRRSRLKCSKLLYNSYKHNFERSDFLWINKGKNFEVTPIKNNLS